MRFTSFAVLATAAFAGLGYANDGFEDVRRSTPDHVPAPRPRPNPPPRPPRPAPLWPPPPPPRPQPDRYAKRDYVYNNLAQRSTPDRVPAPRPRPRPLPPHPGPPPDRPLPPIPRPLPDRARRSVKDDFELYARDFDGFEDVYARDADADDLELYGRDAEDFGLYERDFDDFELGAREADPEAELMDYE